MRTFLILCFSTSLIGCGDKLTPEETFNNYVSSVMSAENLQDVEYSKYISKRAQKKAVEMFATVSPVLVDFDFSISINEKPVELTNERVDVTSADEMFDLFLAMEKEELPICESVNSVTAINGSEATLSCSRSDYTDKHGVLIDKYKRVVSFVDEDGWRIDMIKSEYKTENMTMSSAMFE